MQVPNQFDVNAPINVGSVLQVFKSATDPDVQLNTAIPAGNSSTSLPIKSCGYKVIAIGLTSTQDVKMTVQRYLDANGIIPQDDGIPFTRTFTAGTPGNFNIADNEPFGSFTINIANATANLAIINPFLLVLQAN